MTIFLPILVWSWW